MFEVVLVDETDDVLEREGVSVFELVGVDV